MLGQRQDDEQLHYASRSLHTHEKNYSILSWRLLAWFGHLSTSGHNLLEHHTTVLTDHSACTSLLNSASLLDGLW